MTDKLQRLKEQGINADTCITYLKNSPIFAGSLGSKELFHSNIWAFLIEQQPAFLKAFFPECGMQNVLEDGNGVRREFHHMDLTIETETNLFIIENKIKSLPHEDQLSSYRNGISSINEFERFKYLVNDTKTVQFLLTGLPNEGPSILEGSGWSYRNYFNISEDIRKIAEENLETDSSEVYIFALKYAEMVKMLWTLLYFTIEACRKKLIFPISTNKKKEQSNFDELKQTVPWWNKLEELRISDVFQKLNFDVLTSLIEKEKLSFRSQTGFTRRFALSEFFYEHSIEVGTDSKKGHFRIGVQIQECQFRWYVDICIPNEKIDTKADEIYKAFKDKWFKKLNDEKKISLPIDDSEKKRTSMRGVKDGKGSEYCSFKTTNDVFLYQYYSLDVVCIQEDIKKEVLSFMQCAKKVFNDQGIWQSLKLVFPKYSHLINPDPVL